jgi:hypothetical protein
MEQTFKGPTINPKDMDSLKWIIHVIKTHVANMCKQYAHGFHNDSENKKHNSYV